MSIDLRREVCVCNSVSAEDLVEVIKTHKIQALDALLEQDIICVGDKCESCHEEGYESDGFSLALILARVKQGRL